MLLSSLKGSYMIKRETEGSVSEVERLERCILLPLKMEEESKHKGYQWSEKLKRAQNRSPYLPFQRYPSKPTFDWHPARLTLAF